MGRLAANTSTPQECPQLGSQWRLLQAAAEMMPEVQALAPSSAVTVPQPWGGPEGFLCHLVLSSVSHERKVILQRLLEAAVTPALGCAPGNRSCGSHREHGPCLLMLCERCPDG